MTELTELNMQIMISPCLKTKQQQEQNKTNKQTKKTNKQTRTKTKQKQKQNKKQQQTKTYAIQLEVKGFIDFLGAKKNTMIFLPFLRRSE